MSIPLAKKLLYEDSIFIKRKEFEIEQEWRLVLDDEIEKTRDDWEYYYNWKNEECKFTNHFSSNPIAIPLLLSAYSLH